MERFISTRIHALLGYIVGIILIFTPNIFGFADARGAAVIIPRVVGIILLLSELMTDNGLSLAGLVPMKPHLMMDAVAGLFLIVSPWLWSFHRLGTKAWLSLLILGLLYIGVSAFTQTAPATRRQTSRRAHA
jgi:hypothetical protein